MAIAIKVVAAAGNEDLRRSRRRSAQVLLFIREGVSTSVPDRPFCDLRPGLAHLKRPQWQVRNKRGEDMEALFVSYGIEWLNLLVRWLHLITGIAWIGASFYFVWLENNLNRVNPKDGLSGDLWDAWGASSYDY